MDEAAVREEYRVLETPLELREQLEGSAARAGRAPQRRDVSEAVVQEHAAPVMTRFEITTSPRSSLSAVLPLA